MTNLEYVESLVSVNDIIGVSALIVGYGIGKFLKFSE